jgi:hypothetical protein
MSDEEDGDPVVTTMVCFDEILEAILQMANTRQLNDLENTKLGKIYRLVHNLCQEFCDREALALNQEDKVDDESVRALKARVRSRIIHTMSTSEDPNFTAMALTLITREKEDRTH